MKKIVLCTIFSFILFGADLLQAYENSAYIWQRIWNRHLEEAIIESSGSMDSFLVLAGRLVYRDGHAIMEPVRINWDYFTKAEAPVTLTFRVNTASGKMFEGKEIYDAVSVIVKAVDSAAEKAKKQGVKVTGIQIDYDCPTSKLKYYTRFIGIIREHIEGIEISITALPTWLESREFSRLVKKTSYYTLQLHVYESPGNIEDACRIFLGSDADDYVNRAEKIRHPYHIALPTYGYEVAFGEEGNFIGLRAETPPVFWPEKIRYRTVMADPIEISGFIREIEKMRLKSFKGISWFRLPLKTDEFNWSMKTLKAVMAGREPGLYVKVEIDRVDDGRYEVSLVNAGERDFLGTATFIVSWPGCEEPLYDMLGKYRSRAEGSGGLLVRGPVPKVGEAHMVAWITFTDSGKTFALKSGEVVIDEDM